MYKNPYSFWNKKTFAVVASDALARSTSQNEKSRGTFVIILYQSDRINAANQLCEIANVILHAKCMCM